MKIDIKSAVKNENKVYFQFYRDGCLWYKTVNDELFPVPIDDIGNATFYNEDKALLFMRYMRQFNKSLEEY